MKTNTGWTCYMSTNQQKVEKYVYCQSNPSVEICYRHDSFNDARLNWETFNSPNLFGLFRSDRSNSGAGTDRTEFNGTT